MEKAPSCKDCMNAHLRYGLDDFEHNAQCKALENSAETIHIVTGASSHNVINFLCKDSRNNEKSGCGPSGKWFKSFPVEEQVALTKSFKA